MEFSEKLTFLLNITNTTGAQLAQALEVKSSIISLYKTGKRETPKKESTLKRFADFFASKINDDYQRQALFEIMELPPVSQPFSAEELSDTILMWLAGKKYIAIDPGLKLLTAFERKDEIFPTDFSISPSGSSVNFARGMSGKREVLRNFLSYILTIENPKTLYLQDDDSVEWILNDITLINEIMNTVKVLASRGCRIVQFLPPTSNSSSIKIYTDWMPLYFSSQVDVYYYPRFRDNSFRNSILALDDKAAYFSMGIYDGSSPSFAGIVKTPMAVTVFTDILDDYKRICRDAFIVLRSIQDIDIMRDQMSNLPVPRISSRSMLPHELLSPSLVQLTNDYLASLGNVSYRVPKVSTYVNFFKEQHTDICKVYTKEQILNGEASISIPDFIGVEGPKYTVETYREHLSCILKAMQEHDNYTFIPSPAINDPVTLIIRRSARAILMHKSIHPNVLLVTEPDLIRILEEHLDQRVDKLHYGRDIRKHSMIFLKNLIKELSK